MASHALLKDKVDPIPKDGTPLRRIRPFDWISLASLVVILGIFIYAGHFTSEFPVDVSKVSREYPYQEYTKFSAGGRVVVEHKVSVSPRITGQLAQIMVDKGSVVKKNQVIARLESTDAVLLRDQREADLRLAKARLEQAEIGLSETELDYEHSKEEYREGTIPASEFHATEKNLRKVRSAFDVARATVDAQHAALRSAEAALGHTEVRTPFEGIVLSRDGHIGDTVGPRLSASDEGGGIVTLADLSSLEVEAEVPSREIGLLKVGQPCMVVFDALKVHLKGEVISITPQAGREKAFSGVRVRFIDRDSRILPEMSARIAFLDRQISPTDGKPLILVNRSSVINSHGGYSVFVLRGQKAVEKRVRVGGQLKDKIQICQGITDGDMLIANPPDGITNGARVLADND